MAVPPISSAQRDEHLQEQLRFESLINELSAKLIRLTSTELGAHLADELRRIVEFFEADRGALLQSSTAGELLVTAHSYAVPGIRPAPAWIAGNRTPWCMARLRAGEIVRLPQDLPADAANERRYAEGHGIKCEVAIPLMVAGDVIGVLTVTWIRLAVECTPEQVRRMRLVAEMFANAWMRKRAVETERESAARLRQLFEATRAVPWEADARTGRFTYVGPQAKGLLGYPVESWYEPDFWPSHIHPEDRERAVNLCLAAAQQQDDYEFEYRMLTADGRVAWIHDIVNVVRVDGAPARLRGLMLDISERKAIEQRLVESEAFQASILASLSDHIAVIDRNGVILAANEAWRSFARENDAPDTRRVSVGANYLEVCRRSLKQGDADGEKALSGIESVLNGSSTHFSMEYECSSPTELRWFRMSVVPLGGPRPGAVISHQDITPRKVAEARFLKTHHEILDLKDDLQAQLQFERLVSDLSARFVNVEHDCVESEIVRALQQVLEFFDVDRCGLFKLLPDATTVEFSHMVSRDDVPTPPTRFDVRELFPWSFDKAINKGEPVCLNTLDDFPAAAAKDRRNLENRGIKSILLIPLLAGTAGRYAISISSVKQERRWHGEHTARLRLLGDTFVNALIRKQAEAAARDSAKRLEYALDATEQGVWDWNLETGEVYYSPPWIESLGYSRDEVPGHVSFWESIVHPDDMPRVRQVLQAHLEGQTPIYQVENRLRTKSGEYRWNIDRGRVVEWDADGRPLRMVGTDMDITARKHAENEVRLLRAQLWHMDRVVRTGALSASLAHELNQPLAAILSNAQAALRFLEHDEPDLPEIGEILRDIVSDDKRAAAVISGLRSMLRPQATRREPIDLGETAAEILDLLHSEIVAWNVDVDTVLDTGCRLLADKAQVQQVILNLLMNAIEAMHEQPADQRRLRLSVTRTGVGEVRFAIRDSGVGIPRDRIERVFDAFTTTKAEGMGLGLAVCRSIIELHGGAIWVESNEDRGVTFFFTLPAADAPPTESEPR